MVRRAMEDDAITCAYPRLVAMNAELTKAAPGSLGCLAIVCLFESMCTCILAPSLCSSASSLYVVPHTSTLQ